MTVSTGTTRKNIMHVVWSLEVAGAEKLAYDMVHAIPVDRSRPLVCSVNNGGLLGDMLRAEGFDVYHRNKKPGLDWSVVSWLREILTKEQIDVIHAHQYSPMVYSVLAACGNRRIKIVYTEHGRNYPEQRRWKRQLINPLLAMGIDSIIAIAASTRKAMMKYDSLPGGKINVVHNGVNLKKVRGNGDVDAKRRELGIPAGYDIVGTATRFDEVKNLPMILRAFKNILNVRPETCLLLAGTGRLENELKILASDLGIIEQVYFLGLRHDLPDLLRIYNVFLLSSHTEGISIALLEAMANGIPAVVTEVGGNPEVVVHGDTGYLVPTEDFKTMADRVLQLLENPQLACEMGRNGMLRVERDFSFAKMMAEYLEIYGVGYPSVETTVQG